MSRQVNKLPRYRMAQCCMFCKYSRAEANGQWLCYVASEQWCNVKYCPIKVDKTCVCQWFSRIHEEAAE